MHFNVGRYFAKPQIKEYEFEPKHELLELVEGQTGQVNRAVFSNFIFSYFLLLSLNTSEEFEPI